jgi:hypothetical protein
MPLREPSEVRALRLQLRAERVWIEGRHGLAAT